MPSRTLPTIPPSDIASRNTANSCYVTIGNKVYDITHFLDSHPGGADLILEYGGKDVTSILKDEVSHTHSEAAYDILDESLIGFVAHDSDIDTATKSKNPDQILPLPSTENGVSGLKVNGSVNGVARPVNERTGMASAEDLSRETDYSADFKQHKFLDLNKPLFLQMLFSDFGKDFYLEQVHRPRHYKGGASAPLFGNFLEPLSMTPWYMVPILWLPPVAYGTVLAGQAIGYLQTGVFWIIGYCIWTLVEYLLHRFLFHLDSFLPDNSIALTTHFLLHGIHHYLPMDRYRLVMPPAMFVVLATPFWKLAHFVFFWNWYVATAVYSGGIFGYICYDLTHYFLHHKKLPGYYQELKKYHLEHHFMDYENGFGVTSRFWDRVFGTVLVRPNRTAAKGS